MTDKKLCCGCTACAAVCPHDAISMVEDREGFAYPSVDPEKCTGCGLCEKVCVFASAAGGKVSASAGHGVEKQQNDVDGRIRKRPDTYAARHRNREEVASSRSGAAFVAISDRILASGGLVYGAAMDGNFRVEHRRAASQAERNGFKGSKYAQSDLGCRSGADGIFRQIKQELSRNEGAEILFSGTPCQCAALAGYLGEKNMEHVFLADVICHGVISPALWKAYLAYTQRRYGKKIVSASFRDKEKYGWGARRESVTFEDGTKIYPDIFMDLYHAHVGMRPSCSICPYADVRRVSDITLGDFWGWEKTGSDINSDNLGVSLLLVSTEKGRKMLDSLSGDLRIEPACLKDCIQPTMLHPSAPHPDNARLMSGLAGEPPVFKFREKNASAKIIGRIRRFAWKIGLAERKPAKIRAGIMTFHRACNYGAVLQCYALQEHLKSMGYEVSVIDYRPDYIEREYRDFMFRECFGNGFYEGVRRFLYEICISGKRRKRKKGFRRFMRKYLNVVPASVMKSENAFDVIVFGSDQIWNPEITGGGFDTKYFACFPAARHARRIAYSASMGKSCPSGPEAAEFSRLLGNFNLVSVREAALQEYINSVPGVKAGLALDPTLLAGTEIFDRLSAGGNEEKLLSDNPYVLVYQVKTSPDTEMVAESLALQIEKMNTAGSPEKKGTCKVEIKTVRPAVSRHSSQETMSSPEDFLRLIRNASCVVTTSFHGTALSVLFRKPFYVLETGAESDFRAVSLLESIGLSSRFVAGGRIPDFEDIDFSAPLEKLEELRKISSDFLW